METALSRVVSIFSWVGQELCHFCLILVGKSMISDEIREFEQFSHLIESRTHPITHQIFP
jgi:hypothetical protein